MSRITRRSCLFSIAMAASIAALPQPSVAAGEPIRVVMPYGAGGLIDGVVRQVTEKMAAELGQPIIIENKPGANGIVGASFAASARPDGLTYFVGATGPLSLNVLLRDGLPFSLDSFEPVGTMMSGPLTISVPTATGVESVDELAAFATEAGRPLRYGTLGPGSVTHLFGIVLQDALGVPMTDVAYRDNASMLVDTISGQLELNFSTPISLIEQQNAGALRILAISTENRDPMLPEVPTVTELGHPALQSSFWFGLLAPAGTPEEATRRVSTALQNAMADETLQQRMTAAGLLPQIGGPEALQAVLDRDVAFWGGIIAQNQITLN